MKNQALTDQQRQELIELGKQVGAERLQNKPQKWENSQVSFVEVRRFAPKAVIDGGEAAVEAFLEGYNLVASEFEMLRQRVTVPTNIRQAWSFAVEHNFDPSHFTHLCERGLVPGAKKDGTTWMVTEEGGKLAIEAARRRQEKRQQRGEKASVPSGD